MPTEAWAVAAAMAASLLAALAAFLLKRGAAETRLGLPAAAGGRGFHVSGQVVGAMGLYVASSLLFLLALTGAQLSVLVPVTTLEYVWVALLARRLLGERIGAAKLVGMACIVLGVVFVGLGS